MDDKCPKCGHDMVFTVYNAHTEDDPNGPDERQGHDIDGLDCTRRQLAAANEALDTWGTLWILVPRMHGLPDDAPVRLHLGWTALGDACEFDGGVTVGDIRRAAEAAEEKHDG